MVGVGFGLGVCGDLGTLANTSTTSGVAPSALLTTSDTTPSVVTTLVSIASMGVDMMLFNSSCLSLGNSSNAELTIRASRNSQFMCV